MRPYVLDTNIYIRSVRSEAGAHALEAFSSAFAPALYLHAVVAMELLAGATSASLRRKTESSFIRPFERRRRVFAPGLAAWKRAGEIVAELIGARKLSPSGVSRSFVNDCLLAASAREHGFVLVTENTRDFQLIATVSPFEFVAPWPE